MRTRKGANAFHGEIKRNSVLKELRHYLFKGADRFVLSPFENFDGVFDPCDELVLLKLFIRIITGQDVTLPKGNFQIQNCSFIEKLIISNII